MDYKCQKRGQTNFRSDTVIVDIMTYYSVHVRYWSCSLIGISAIEKNVVRINKDDICTCN